MPRNGFSRSYSVVTRSVAFTTVMVVSVLAACDHVAFIPQLGRVGSLNVSTAAAIAMYEWARQQWAPPT